MQQAVGALSQAHTADMSAALGRLHLLEAKAVQATEVPSVGLKVPVASGGAHNAAQVPTAEPKLAAMGFFDGYLVGNSGGSIRHRQRRTESKSLMSQRSV